MPALGGGCPRAPPPTRATGRQPRCWPRPASHRPSGVPWTVKLLVQLGNGDPRPTCPSSHSSLLVWSSHREAREQVSFAAGVACAVGHEFRGRPLQESLPACHWAEGGRGPTSCACSHAWREGGGRDRHTARGDTGSPWEAQRAASWTTSRATGKNFPGQCREPWGARRKHVPRPLDF